MENSKKFLTSILSHNIEVNIHDESLKCASGFSRRSPGTIYPKDENQIKQILNQANLYKVGLFPISTGKNWGFGSNLPVQDDCFILNLSKLNQIFHIDHENGFAIIGPGVTQKELSDALLESNYYLDVTGASSNTSIIGNALERGIAYNTLRVETISNMKIILPNGDTISTGFGSTFEDNNSNYAWGIGPSLDGLFFQSNLGIITQAKIKLLKRPQKIQSFMITIKDSENLSDFSENLRALLEDSTINCIPHIFNKERLFPAMAPLMWKFFKDQGIHKSRNEINKILEKQFPGEWFAAGNIKGSNQIIQYTTKQIKKICNSNCTPTFIGKKEIFLINMIKRLPFLNDLKSIIYSTELVRDLTTGVPTDLTLPSIQWPIEDNPSESYFNKDIDNAGNGGFLYFTPMANFTKKNIKKMIRLTYEIFEKYSLTPAITFNAIKPETIEGVISVHFNKNEPGEVKKAHQCIQELNTVMIDSTFYPYRTNIDMMNTMHYRKHYNILLQKLKATIDPNNIISPGRYIQTIKETSEKKAA